MSLHLDPNATAAANAAWSWIQRGNRTLMRGYLLKLTTTELTELAMYAFILADAAMDIAEQKTGLVAAAVLTPDCPEGVDGFAIEGVHTGART